MGRELGHPTKTDLYTEDRLYVVIWRPKGGTKWSMVKDETDERLVPAAYVGEVAAYERCDLLADLFPECEYRVEVFDAR